MDKFETLEDYQNSLKEFNEQTRKSYEDFIQKHGDDSQKLQLRCTPYTEKKGRYGVASLDFGFQIWQLKQAEIDEKDKRIVSQNDFIEIALITLNHLKENAVTHRDYGHECNWTRSFNDLIKLASDAEDSLKEALRGERE